MARRTRSLLLAALVAGLGALALLWTQAADPVEGARPADPAAAPPTRAQDQARPAELAGEERAAPARASVESGPADAPIGVQQGDAGSAEQGPTLRGRVVDLEGRPIARALIAAGDDPKRTLWTSAADGTFPLAKEREELVIRSPEWIAVRQTEPLARAGSREVLLLAAPRLALAGRVVDGDGAPLGAQLEVEIEPTSFARFPEPLDRAREPRAFRGSCDADGSFELECPGVAHGTLTATHEGHASAALPLPTISRRDILLTLQREAAQGGVLVEGVVVHADGSPVAQGETLVHLGEQAHPIGSGGRFSFRVSREIEDGAPLVAVKRGHQPAVVAAFGAQVRTATDEVEFQRLVLGPPPLSIAGRVVDAEGRPRKGWIVQPIDPVLLLEGHIPPRSVEALVLEDALSVATDAEGRFELRGLLERSYRLQAHSREELVRIESDPIAAGSRNVELVVPADARIAKLAGVVVGRDGRGVAGVRVRAGLITFRTQSGYTTEHSDGVETDAEGRFELEGVPRRSSTIDLAGDAILPVSVWLEELELERPLRVEVARRCHFRIEGVPDGSKIERVALRDARGNGLQIMRFQTGGWWSSGDIALADGMTAVLAVSEDARTLVFLGPEQEEIAARALSLAPGEITVVRW